MDFDDAWTSGPDILRRAIERVSPDMRFNEDEIATLGVLLLSRPEAERDPAWTREQVLSYFGPETKHRLPERLCDRIAASVQQDILFLKSRQIEC